MSLHAPTAASPEAVDHADGAHAGGAAARGAAAGGTRTDAASAIVDIYTDGACKGNPGPGGWGALLKSGAHERELFGGQPLTTNNRMELTAVIEALRALRRASRVRVWTDSQYVRLGITQWIAQWRARGWKTADRKPVKNADLWQSLEAACAPHAIEWHWVRGHAGHPGNERADALANRGVPAAGRAGRP